MKIEYEFFDVSIYIYMCVCIYIYMYVYLRINAIPGNNKINLIARTKETKCIQVRKILSYYTNSQVGECIFIIFWRFHID